MVACISYNGFGVCEVAKRAIWVSTVGANRIHRVSRTPKRHERSEWYDTGGTRPTLFFHKSSLTMLYALLIKDSKFRLLVLEENFLTASFDLKKALGSSYAGIISLPVLKALRA